MNAAAVGVGVGVLAAMGTAGALMAHDKGVVDNLETVEERNKAVDQFSGAVDTIGWVGLGATLLVPSSWNNSGAIKAAGWGAMIGNMIGKEITQNVVLNRVENTGKWWNPFDNKMEVGPAGH